MPTLVVGMQVQTEEHAHDQRGHGTHNFKSREGLAADSHQCESPKSFARSKGRAS